MKGVAKEFLAFARTSLLPLLWWWRHWHLMCRCLRSSCEARFEIQVFAESQWLQDLGYWLVHSSTDERHKRTPSCRNGTLAGVGWWQLWGPDTPNTTVMLVLVPEVYMEQPECWVQSVGVCRAASELRPEKQVPMEWTGSSDPRCEPTWSRCSSGVKGVSEVAGSYVPAPWATQSSSSWGLGQQRLPLRCLCSDCGCWLLQLQRLLVSSVEQASGVHADKYYGVCCYESCGGSTAAISSVETLRGKGCWGPHIAETTVAANGMPHVLIMLAAPFPFTPRHHHISSELLSLVILYAWQFSICFTLRFFYRFLIGPLNSPKAIFVDSSLTIVICWRVRKGWYLLLCHLAGIPKINWGEWKWKEHYRKKGMGKKGHYGIIWNHVYESFENCKALYNLKNLSFNKDSF